MGHIPSNVQTSNPSSCKHVLLWNCAVLVHSALDTCPAHRVCAPLPALGVGVDRVPPISYPPPARGRVCLCPSGLGYGGMGGGGGIETIFFGPLAPICAYFSALEPVSPVFGASLSPCPPCASLFAEFFIGRPSGRGPTPARGPNVRPWLMRTAILLGLHLNPSDFSSQAWSGPVSTEVGDHLGTLGAVRFLCFCLFPAPPRGPPPHAPAVPIPPLPPKRAHMAHVPLRTARLLAAPFHANPLPATF